MSKYLKRQKKLKIIPEQAFAASRHNSLAHSQQYVQAERLLLLAFLYFAHHTTALSVSIKPAIVTNKMQ